MYERACEKLPYGVGQYCDMAVSPTRPTGPGCQLTHKKNKLPLEQFWQGLTFFQKQTKRQKIVFTDFSRSFMIPVNNLALDNM